MMFEKLTEQEKHEVRMYGVTVAEMNEAVAQSIKTRHGTAARMVTSIISDCVENLEHADDLMVAMDIRQALNRANWIINQYCS